MRPILVVLNDGHEHSVEAVRARIAEDFQLSAEDLEERLPSGRAKTFSNRVGWATTYLYRCGLVARPRRSIYEMTHRGREVLRTHPDRVDLSVLSQFEEFHEFRRARTDPAAADGGVVSTTTLSAADHAATPEERIAGAYRELRGAVAEELRDRVLDQSPEFLEQLVLDVLHAMGYGGSRPDATERLGQSGDEGIDGIIREDKLGLEQIYVQAKRWAADRTVGRPEIQRFVGALHGQRASKGVFITTSSFSSEAMEYAAHVVPRVVLIDGRELAQLMIDHAVGVSIETRIEIKRVDSDYFDVDAIDS
jgi:restriction system protein